MLVCLIIMVNLLNYIGNRKVKMNTKLTVLLSFGLGGLVGYFVAAKLLEKKYSELAQEEIDNVKDYFYKKYEPDVVGENDDEEKYRKVVTSYTKPSLHDLATMHANEEKVDEELDEDEDEDEELDELGLMAQEQLSTLFSEKEEKVEPYLIDFQTFSEKSELFDKVTLFYYRFDDVICDNNDVVIEEPEEILGWDFHTALTRKTTVFVRNTKLNIDYELNSLSKSYSDEVKAKLETDSERKYRRLARQKKALDDANPEEIDEEMPEPIKKKRVRTPKKPIIIEDDDSE